MIAYNGEEEERQEMGLSYQIQRGSLEEKKVFGCDQLVEGKKGVMPDAFTYSDGKTSSAGCVGHKGKPNHFLTSYVCRSREKGEEENRGGNFHFKTTEVGEKRERRTPAETQRRNKSWTCKVWTVNFGKKEIEKNLGLAK